MDLLKLSLHMYGMLRSRDYNTAEPVLFPLWSAHNNLQLHKKPKTTNRIGFCQVSRLRIENCDITLTHACVTISHA